MGHSLGQRPATARSLELGQGVSLSGEAAAAHPEERLEGRMGCKEVERFTITVVRLMFVLNRRIHAPEHDAAISQFCAEG